MKTNKVMAVAGILAYLTMLWLQQNGKYLSLPVPKALYWMNNTAHGFNSIRSLALFYPIPFFLFINHLFLGERPYTIIRRRSRMTLYRAVVLRILAASVLFSICHLSVNVGWSYVFLDGQALNESRFLSIALANMVGLVCYFFWVGLLYRLVHDLSHSVGAAMLFTAFLLGAVYFVGKLYLSPETLWQPLNDMVLFQFLIERKWTGIDVLLTYVRQLSLGLGFCFMGSVVLLRKDFTS
ncbi:MAG TPA: WxPxxD family membrane protein [Bacillales bacterium]|nr:WxPxxD family membrane protein [Bacillales bacterium]